MNESSFEVDEIFPDVNIMRFAEDWGELEVLRRFDKVLTDKGFCYTVNLLNHDEIFTDAISKDFESYKREIFLGSTYNMFQKVEIKFNETKVWSLDGGYKTGEFEMGFERF